MNRSILLATVVCCAGLVSSSALADRPFPARYDNAVNCGSAAGGVAAFFSGPAAPFVVAGVGGFQVGWWLGRTIVDPPDTANAGIPVNSNDFLTGHQFPSFATIVPGGDPTLSGMMDGSMGHVDQAVALARSVNASMDRYQGALILGNSAFAASRLSEAQSFLAQLKTEANTWQTTIPGIVNRIDLIQPGLLDNLVTQADSKYWRTQTAAGNLPSLEPMPWGVYAPTSTESADIMARAAALDDPSINTKFGGASSQTIRSILLNGSVDIAEVMQTTSLVPTPGGGIALLAGVGLLARRRRRAA